VNVTDYLLDGKPGQELALLFPARDATYSVLVSTVHRTAASLAASGVRKGDRVLLLAENSFFWVSAYLATLRIGAVSVPLATIISAADLAYIIESTSPACALASGLQAKKHATVLGGVPLVIESDWEKQINRDPVAEIPSDGTSAGDLAALMFTSGSTGQPRGVMVTHGNIIANTDSIIAALSLTSSDRVMAVLPFHYCFGTSLLHTHLRVGGSIVIDNRFLYPEAVLRRMNETRCTGFAGVPSHFQILLRKSGLGKMNFPHLRYVQQAGGHLAPVFLRELRESLPGKQIFVMYGQTEATARLTTLPAGMLDAKPGSIGKPIPGVSLQLITEDGRLAGPGETGEIVAQGANITAGYWHDNAETSHCFRNGRLHTGDIATMDEDGFYFIVGRAKDFLKCGGKRVSARQLEETMLEHPDVVEAAIVGIPDEVLGEAVKAFVVPRTLDERALEESLRQFCKSRLPIAFQPKEIIITTALPKNSAGKILKAALPR